MTLLLAGIILALFFLGRSIGLSVTSTRIVFGLESPSISVFAPDHRTVNVTDDGIVFVGKVFHSAVGTPVFQRKQEFVFDLQSCGGLAAALVQYLVGCLQDFKQPMK